MKVIAFDEDDTLWSNEPFFKSVEHQFEQLLTPYAPDVVVLDELFQTEMANLDTLGYGAKAFTISMIETALRISHQKVSHDTISQIIVLGKSLLQNEINPLDGVVDALNYLQEKQYRLVIATKGEHRDQINKLKRSGLEHYFDFIEVMQDKTEKEYLRMIDILQVKPEEFLMIGNSFKSDIQPVLEIGGYGIHIPFAITWKHELVDTYTHPHLITLKSIKDIIGIL
jgi:putative hydrolase of the HAD superfamily